MLTVFALPKLGSVSMKYSRPVILVAAVLGGNVVLAKRIKRLCIFVRLQPPLASRLRTYNLWTPGLRVLTSTVADEAVISVPGVTAMLVPFPNPGSLSKKYSSLVIFTAAKLAGIENVGTINRLCILVRLQLPLISWLLT